MKTFIALLALFTLMGCSTITPMTIKPYQAPDLSSIQKPTIPALKEGVDFIIDPEKNTVTFTVTGADLLAAKILSEQTAWQQIESLKSIISIQSEIINQEQQLVVTVDLARQYAEKGKETATIKEYAAYLFAAIFTALVIFAK